MLNTVLAGVAVSIWSTAYGLYFARDVRRWWKLRPQRRIEAARARLRAIEEYAAWTRNIPPPRSRVAVIPVKVPEPRTAVVLPFPRNRRLVRR